MTTRRSSGRDLRLRRLFRRVPDRLFVVPLDHSLTDGPITGGPGGLSRLVCELAAGGTDAVVVHKGSARHLDPEVFLGTSLIVHLSAGTVHASDPDDKYPVATVEEALRLGADAVSVHVNLGSDGERAQISALGAVAEACDRWNMPLLAMMYPRGPRIADPLDPALIAHAATVAADLGADVVKSVYAGSPGAMADVVGSCPVPVIVAGGSARGDTASVVAFVEDALSAGAAGVAMGRNVFQAAEPGARARAVAEVVHRAAPSPHEQALLTAGRGR
ncbi:2-amino-3,7-dideoxy-D-threo-hept-6-ulosonate synthase [Saccharothrix australiensis]|uniref:2-amino-3,7-dideoxy-D-threo-hept-6-ulosonate synthase n=1 Tax=Saccharothrix australiensis TaxID=2072 RepID=A0A495W4X2_9PSEU|nr:2-amino-3,7-dideoxy-D-threo-hept-6-ulosonate synthase [Saccharothrix australiensis]RKT55703.1 2-amino-3,7-dideoxy-D-threo-hept-6-ulosonate synthase [Saccharothrix australiensis]